MNLDYREFTSRSDLEDNAFELLKKALSDDSPSPRLLMLTGGSTPFGVYERVRHSGIRPPEGLHVFLSDDRHVPQDSPASNYGRLCPMLDALNVKKRIRVDPTVPVAVAAERFDRDLKGVMNRALPFPLGILGLGADGHVAGLFTSEQLAEAAGKQAIAVRRPDEMNGISATPSVLCAADRLVFWVAGLDKREAVETLRNQPLRIPAGLALDAAPSVELWYAPV